MHLHHSGNGCALDEYAPVGHYERLEADLDLMAGRVTPAHTSCALTNTDYSAHPMITSWLRVARVCPQRSACSSTEWIHLARSVDLE